MNVEIGSEAALFPEKEYITGIAVAVWLEDGGARVWLWLWDIGISGTEEPIPTNRKRGGPRYLFLFLTIKLELVQIVLIWLCVVCLYWQKLLGGWWGKSVNVF